MNNNISMPTIELYEIEDFYVYYVYILKISEELFWHADISFLNKVVANINAYEGWKSYEISKTNKK